MYVVIHLPGTKDYDVANLIHDVAALANSEASSAYVKDDDSLKIGKHTISMEDIFEAAQE